MKSMALALLLACTVCPLLGGTRAEAEYKLYPSLTVSELWTDNLENDEHDKITEYVTRIMPSITLDYLTPRVDLDLSYMLDYHFFAKGERGNEAVHFLDLKSLMNYREFLYLEVVENLARVSLDSTRDYTEESLFQNQSDRNAFSISPYVQFRPSFRTTFKGGFLYANIDYESETAVDRERTGYFLEGDYELSDRLTSRAGYEFTDEDTSEDDYRKHDVWIGLRWQSGKDTYFFGTIGHTWVNFIDGPEAADLTWDFGLSHDFGLLLATAAVGVHYWEDPEEGTILRQENYSLSFSRDWTRSRLAAGVSYSNFYDVEVDDVDTRRYGFNTSISHELSSRWIGGGSLSAEKFEDPVEDTWTRLILGRLTLSYLFAEDLTGTFSYQWIDSHSPEVPDDRYETNIVTLEMRKVF